MNKINGENFESVVEKEKGLFVIKFFSPSCGPCHTMTPVFEALDKNNPDVNVYEIDTSESPELAAHFGVRGVPFVAYCEEREILYHMTGVTPLGTLQYVIDNINDPYFKEHGDFKKPEVKKSWAFEFSIVALILFFTLVIIFYR